MARVVALIPDLLFGSRIQGALTAAGNEVELIGDETRLRARLADPEKPVADVLVVDLTDARLDGAGIVAALAGEGELHGEGAGAGRALRTLGFYSHVDVVVREQAEQTGFDLVVPRSRMAREGAELVRRLAA
jgi:acetylornithine deacetylase/succinyl-diaminopimelate desuccinylase-like protein